MVVFANKMHYHYSCYLATGIPMQLKKSNCYRINRIKRDVPVSYRHKLLSMGLLPGTTFEVLGVAPLGDPVAIKLKDFCLSLRKKELAAMEIEAA